MIVEDDQDVVGLEDIIIVGRQLLACAKRLIFL